MSKKTRTRVHGAFLPEPRSLSLKRSVFLRMLLITLAAVLVFYIMGLTVNQLGIRNVRRDMQTALQTGTEYAASQLSQEIEALKFFMLEMLSDKQLLRYAISHDILTDWEHVS